jgi:hypothetical protein
MKISEIKEILASTELPVTYYQWPEGGVPQLPYLVWYLGDSDNFAADSKVYQRIEPLFVELYANPRSFATEETVESVLNDAELVWDKSPSFLDTEEMYLTTYEMDVLIQPEADAASE